MSKNKKRKRKASRSRTRPRGSSSLRWEFDYDVPTDEFFIGALDDPYHLFEAVESFVSYVKRREFLTWEAVVSQEQGIRLTRRQKEALADLMSFDDDGEDRILYIDEIARPSEPWHALLNQIAPHLLIEPFRTFDMHDEVQSDGWKRIMTALRQHGQGLSLPPGADDVENVVPAELRHKLWLQSCFDNLSGVGQNSELTLEDPEEHYRVEWLVADLRECKESVAYFNLSLESLLTRVILPEKEQPIFTRMMQEQLGLNSLTEPLANRL